MAYDRYFAIRDRAILSSRGSAIIGGILLAAVLVVGLLRVEGEEAPITPVQVQPKTAAEFHEKIEPLLVSYCYECHGFGEKKGEIKLDANDDRLVGDVQLWLKVLKNVRSRVMPPAGSDRGVPPSGGLAHEFFVFSLGGVRLRGRFARGLA
jgi:hypothetical protein